MTTATVTTTELSKYLEVLKKDAPQLMRTTKRVSLIRIGRETIKELRRTGLTGFKSKKVGNTFKRQVLNNDNTLSIYSKWKGAGIHETGGTINAKTKMLLVWLKGGRKPNGSRKFSEAQIKSEIESGKMFFMKRVGRPTLLVRQIGKQTKSGGWSKGARLDLIAVLKRSVKMKSRYSLVAAHNRAGPAHEKVMSKTLNEVIDDSRLVD